LFTNFDFLDTIIISLKNKNKNMTDKKSIAAIRDLIISAEKSIKNAKKILKDVLEENNLSMEVSAELDTK
jgi:hypothetical protein